MDYSIFTALILIFTSLFVKLTVFKLEGPLNVPDHSKHHYQAGGATPSAESTWLPSTQSTTAQFLNSPNKEPDTAEYTWGEGEKTGLAIYRASKNYIWQVEVNIVNITLGTNIITHAPTGISQAANDPANGTTPNMIQSNVPGEYAMRNRAEVQVHGPTRAGRERGIEFIEIGIIQMLDIGKKQPSNYAHYE